MFLSLLLPALLLQAAPDTLSPVVVTADRGVVVSRADTVKITPYAGAAFPLVGIPSLYIGDYGGAAALKSASLRGLGSAHTAVYIDGVRVGNLMSGQGDLGLLDAASYASAVVDYAQNSVSFNTAKPVFNGRPIAGSVRQAGGSFGLWQPYARIDFRLSDRASLSAHLGAELDRGDFPLADGTRRTNNDIYRLNGGLDAFGQTAGGFWQAKAQYTGADRGTPGSLGWPSADRQTDRAGFVQGRMQQRFTDVYTLDLSVKGAIDAMQYQSEWGDSDYAQKELQLNSAHRFLLLDWLTASLAADVQADWLSGSVYNDRRLATVLAAGLALRTGRLKADVALEYEGSFDGSGSSWNTLSPSADIRLALFGGLDLVAFGRRAFRTPTFNELYYPGYGNPALHPEDAWLTDAGLDWKMKRGGWSFSASGDFFCNILKDKIVSAPSEADPYIWLPYNVGKVLSLGADAAAGFGYAAGDWKASLGARYCLQNATDRTPDSYSFGEQIPYVSRHTVALTAGAGWKGWSLDGAFNLRSGRRDGSGEMPDWSTLDASFGKSFSLGSGMSLELSMVARNLLNSRYEVIRDYPMPGRSFIVGGTFRF